jgi:regulator of nonsense transcripts 2
MYYLIYQQKAKKSRTELLQVGERAPSPDEEIVLSASNNNQEYFGPSEEADTEFAKELAKLVTDTSAESRKIDKRTALALWDSAVLPPALRKKKNIDDGEEEEDVKEVEGSKTMNFTVVTKRGNKQLVSNA